jgi:hypothetical protein
MLPTRKNWLERATNWGIAIAVPLVAIGGFKLLAHARDGAQPLPGQAAPPTASGRILAPPIDATAPPVVTLQPAPAGRPAAGVDPRCPTGAGLPGSDRERTVSAQARRSGCPPR